MGRPGTFRKGQSGNPGGKPAKTDAQREADEILRAGSPLAARKLLELCANEDNELALKAATALLKMTNGDLVRAAVDEDGKTVGKIDAEEIAQRARTLIAARLLVAPSHEIEYQSAKEKSK